MSEIVDSRPFTVGVGVAFAVAVNRSFYTNLSDKKGPKITPCSGSGSWSGSGSIVIFSRT